jgi:hypothetical protein
VRPEHDLVSDIARHGRLVFDLTGDLDEATFVRGSATASTPSAPLSRSP